MKHNVILSIVLNAILYLIGDISANFIVLGIFVVIDFVIGYLSAIFNRSQKTEDGGVSSKVCYIGILKKCGILICVIISNLFDKIMGLNFVRSTTIIFFIINEATSILENLGGLGVPIPEIIKKSISMLKKQEGENAKFKDSI